MFSLQLFFIDDKSYGLIINIKPTDSYDSLHPKIYDFFSL